MARPGVFVLTRRDIPGDQAGRDALRGTISQPGNICFVEEAALLKLLGANDLETACRWMLSVQVLCVLVMSRDGVVMTRRGEQIYGPPCPGFTCAPHRYAEGFLQALSRGDSLVDCAAAAAQSTPRTEDELRRLLPAQH